MKHALLLCSFLGFIHVSLFAQETQYKFENYTVDHGLSQSTVYSILQDSTGFIWAGTRDGLNRFDGHTFKVYQPGIGAPSLSERTIRDMEIASNHSLWVGTDGGGIFHFNTADESFTNICTIISTPGCQEELNVLSIAIQDHILWAGTRDNGVLKFDLDNNMLEKFLGNETVWAVVAGKAGEVYAGTNSGITKINENIESIYSQATVYSLFFDTQSERLWAGTNRNGVRVFDLNNQAKRIQLDLLNEMSSKTINTISRGYGDEIWLGTGASGVYVYSPEESLNRISAQMGNEQSLSENSIRSIFKDNADVVWIGTNTSGLSNYSPNRFTFPHYIQNKSVEGNSAQVILSFTELSEQKILVGTERNGLLIFDEQNQRLSPINFLNETTIVSLMKDRENQLWIGSDGMGLYTIEPRNFNNFEEAEKIENLTNNSVLSMIQLSKNTFIVGTYRGLNWIKNGQVTKKKLADIEDKTALQSGRILALYPENNSDFWVGTYSGGLSYYDAEGDTFRTYTETGEEGSISSNRVQVIYKDKQGRLWVGTYNGLNRFDYETEEFEVYTERAGLPSAVIYGILEDENGYLWLSTNQGISRFEPESSSFENFMAADGLQSNEFNGGAYFKDSSGKMYFGGINGFNAFNPAELSVNRHVPNTVITEFSVEGEDIKVTDTNRSFTFNYQDSYFLFEFKALDFTKPQKHKFRYKLLGFDDSWVSIGERKTVNFSGLPSGRYQFIVQGTNGDGIWGQASKPVIFSITPPFWQNNLFRLAVLLLFGGGLYSAYKYRTYYLLKEERTRNRIARDLHDDLSATLSSISFFSEAAKRVSKDQEGEAHRYLQMIDRSAVEAKEKINDIIWAIDPSNDDWSVFLKKCKRFAADVFDSKEIEYRLEIDDDFDVPLSLELRQNLWLIFKESLSNLIRYSEATEARVRMVKQEGHIILEIEDNGKGFDPNEQQKGHGIENLYYRADQIKGFAQLRTAPGEGTHWHFKFAV